MQIKIQIRSSRFLRALQFTRLCAHCHPYMSFRAALSSRTGACPVPRYGDTGSISILCGTHNKIISIARAARAWCWIPVPDQAEDRLSPAGMTKRKAGMTIRCNLTYLQKTCFYTNSSFHNFISLSRKGGVSWHSSFGLFYVLFAVGVSLQTLAAGDA